MLCNMRALRPNFLWVVATAILLLGFTVPSNGKDRGESQSKSSFTKQSETESQDFDNPQLSKPSNRLASIPRHSTVRLPNTREFDLLSREPFDLLHLENIKPLYTDPKMEGEGIWESATSPRDSRGLPIIYKTFYRPSVEFPNAVRIYHGY